MLILLISTQKLYFGDSDAIYELIVKSAMIHLLNYQAFKHTQPLSFSDKIDKINFAVRGPSSLNDTIQQPTVRYKQNNMQ